MKKLFLLLLIIVPVVLCVNACKKKVLTCPAYESDFMEEWFSYSGNMEVYFSTNEGERDTLIPNAIIEHAEVVPKQDEGFVQWEEHCSVGSVINSKTSAEHPHWLNMNLNHIVRGLADGERLQLVFGSLSMELYINGGDFSGKLSQDTKAQYRYDKIEHIDGNGTRYDDVIMLSVVDLSIFPNDLESHQIDKVYIVKGKGIVGYRTYPEGKEYWLK